MLLSGGGILGVGTPEIIVVCAVGYFLLGPSELYKLAKEIGKLVAQARQALADSAAEWQNTMDEQFEFQELNDVRAAAQELQEAFNFRSDRYMNEWRDYKNPRAMEAGRMPDPLAPPPEGDVPDMLSVDDWNANILKKEQEGVLAAAAGTAAVANSAPPLPEDESLSERKREALERIEREFEQKRRQLELEFEFERQKVQIEMAATEEELSQQQL